MSPIPKRTLTFGKQMAPHDNPAGRSWRSWTIPCATSTTLEEPGANPLRNAHTKLDTAVRAAYGMSKDADGAVESGTMVDAWIS